MRNSLWFPTRAVNHSSIAPVHRVNATAVSSSASVYSSAYGSTVASSGRTRVPFSATTVPTTTCPHRGRSTGPSATSGGHAAVGHVAVSSDALCPVVDGCSQTASGMAFRGLSAVGSPAMVAGPIAF